MTILHALSPPTHSIHIFHDVYLHPERKSSSSHCTHSSSLCIHENRNWFFTLMALTVVCGETTPTHTTNSVEWTRFTLNLIQYLADRIMNIQRTPNNSSLRKISREERERIELSVATTKSKLTWINHTHIIWDGKMWRWWEKSRERRA